jgi:methionyl-tRNA formyltransferase
LRVAFAGTPEFALPTLQALAQSRHALAGVLTQPDRPKGRGQHTAASPVKRAAQALQLPVSQPRSLARAEERAELESWRPDVLVVVAYGLILPPVALGLPRLGCVNIHASLLPRWRGAAPIQRAILAGDDETGATIMAMDAGLDTGPILLQRKIAIDPRMTSRVLHDRLAQLGAAALLTALDDLEAGRARPQPQADTGVTYAAKIEKAEALIDWRLSAEVIERRVRAFDPWPVAETRAGGEQLRIFSAHAVTSESDEPPGTLLTPAHDAIVVRCGEGALAITELQRAGRKRLSARDFLNAGDLAAGGLLG